MSEYTPITYKIRERMEQAERILPIVDGAQYTQVRINLAWLTERLDEIDSVHAALERENERLRDRDGWVELPKDADGEPIHVGDEVTEHEDGHTFKVDGFMDWDGEWWAFQRDAIQAPARLCTHYHAPTVEDVLREFANEVYADADNEIRDRDFLCAKYAKRLTLAGDVE